MSPGVLPVSVPYNPANAISGGAPSLFIPQGFQPKPQAGNSPSPTTSTPTNAPGPQFIVTSSRSETQSSASSASESPSTMNPPEPGAAVRQQGAGVSGEETQENEGGSKKGGEDVRVQPYVNFSDFYRQVDQYGEAFVYGWDKDMTEAPA